MAKRKVKVIIDECWNIELIPSPINAEVKLKLSGGNSKGNTVEVICVMPLNWVEYLNRSVWQTVEDNRKFWQKIEDEMKSDIATYKTKTI